MTQLYTNYGDISLPMAVWLAANDGYDLKRSPKTVSATTLLKPLKSVVLSEALAQQGQQGPIDIQDLIPSRLGTAVHTAVEVAWVHSHRQAMINLGMAPKAIEMVKINPNPKDVTEDDYPIYMEIRSEAEVLGYTISGKFDIVENGRVKDVKSTKVYAWVNGSNDEKYTWQGSIYRWLNQEIITDDFMDIEFLLTDWSSLKAQTDKNYPSRPLMTKTLPLKTLAETEDFIFSRIRLIDAHMGKPEEQIPPCTADEVWQRPTTWAYFKNANNKRATRVFDNEHEAMKQLYDDGNVGRIDRRDGAVKFCLYCPARVICQQAESYQQRGLLDL
jgi:hypothetical protein